QAPPLVSIVDSPAIQAESSIAPNVVAAASSGANEAVNREMHTAGARPQLASFTTAAAKHVKQQSQRRTTPGRELASRMPLPATDQSFSPRLIEARQTSSFAPDGQGEVVVTFVQAQFISRQSRSAAPEYWQVSAVEIHWIASVDHVRKEVPKKS